MANFSQIPSYFAQQQNEAQQGAQMGANSPMAALSTGGASFGYGDDQGNWHWPDGTSSKTAGPTNQQTLGVMGNGQAPTGETYNAQPYQMPGQGQPQGSAGGGSAPGSAPGFTGGNPYLPQMANALTQQATQAFNRNVMPAIGSQAMASGGYGGSRQGVVEANAMNDLGQNITNGLAGMYGNAYNTGLQYDLGLRNNNLGFANLDRSINNDNNQWALQGANFGLGINDRLMGNNQTGINAGTAMQNTPQNYWSQFSQGANSLGQGYGTTTGTQTNQGNPMAGMMGGAQMGQAAANWWSSNNSGGGGSGGYTPWESGWG